MQMAPLDDPDSSPSIGLAAYPLPIVRDQGRWLLSYPLPEGDGCPFESATADEMATPRPPEVIGPPDPIGLGLDFAGLTAPPGTESHSGGWGGGEGEVLSIYTARN